ncbi:MAG: NHL repeat-containing protein, partial [Proteobacteria bacterium]|nr:NHL repeat-containing protein [Pseudomonadota bacterium]
ATALTATAAGALCVLVLTLWVAPSLVVTIEGLLGHGFDIEMRLRIHFGFAGWLVLLALLARLFVWPLREPGARLMAWALVVEVVILMAIWVLDRDAEFQGETSALTFFSAVVLLLCSIAALLNFRASRRGQQHRAAPLFWAVMTAAFLLACLDEYFTLHERVSHALAPFGQQIGLPEEILQDAVTLGYAVGAVAVVVLFRDFVRSELRRAVLPMVLFVVAIGLYGAAVLNDTVDVVAERLWPHSDPAHLMNFLEEALEFTAGFFFLGAFTTRLLEEGGVSALGPQPGAPAPRWLRFSIFALAASTAVGTAVAVVTAPLSPILRWADGNVQVSVFADARAGLSEVDALFVHPRLGLLAGSGGGVLRFDDTGAATPWVAPGGELHCAEGFAVWKDGTVVADDSGAQVLRFDEQGGSPQPVGASTAWVSPEAVAVGPLGRLHVADEDLRAVVRLDPGGPVVLASALDGLRLPEGMVFDDRGILYLTDEGARAIFRITPQGEVTRLAGTETGLQAPEGIAYRDGHLYVSDTQAVSIFRFDLEGRGGPVVSLAWRYRELGGLAFDDEGVLYLAVGSQYRPHNFIFRIRGLP